MKDNIFRILKGEGMNLSYRIRYKSVREQPKAPCFGLQAAAAAGILTGAVVLGWLWPEGSRTVTACLAGAEPTALEQATGILAQAVASGKGWYHALAAFCAKLLEPA